jgi:hypothetical protein
MLMNVVVALSFFFPMGLISCIDTKEKMSSSKKIDL